MQIQIQFPCSYSVKFEWGRGSYSSAEIWTLQGLRWQVSYDTGTFPELHLFLICKMRLVMVLTLVVFLIGQGMPSKILAQYVAHI